MDGGERDRKQTRRARGLGRDTRQALKAGDVDPLLVPSVRLCISTGRARLSVPESHTHAQLKPGSSPSRKITLSATTIMHLGNVRRHLEGPTSLYLPRGQLSMPDPSSYPSFSGGKGLFVLCPYKHGEHVTSTWISTHLAHGGSTLGMQKSDGSSSGGASIDAELRPFRSSKCHASLPFIRTAPAAPKLS